MKNVESYDICVFGGCALDSMYYQNEDGTYPDEASINIPGGKAANQAVAAARAGATVRIISRLGNDIVGNAILSNLKENKINIDSVELRDDIKNDVCKIYIENTDKDNDIVREAGAIDSFDIKMVNDNKRILLKSKIIVAQMKAPKEVMVELINFCHEHDKYLIVTPCRPEKLNIKDKFNETLIDKISMITCNKKECETIFDTTDIESCVKRYPNKLIVTLGADGAMYHNGTEIIKISGIKLDEIEDTTGAGDTFNGNLAAGLIKHSDLYDAILRAQYASAMKVKFKTAQAGMPHEFDLNEFIKEINSNNFEYQKEFMFAYELVQKAYDKIAPLLIGAAKQKKDGSFVTEHDLLVENYIKSKIAKYYPNDEFIGEESNHIKVDNKRLWVLDPIDGTAHYLKHSLFWGIQIAFLNKGEKEFSIIYLPKLNEIYYSFKGIGTFKNHLKINVDDEFNIKKSIVEYCGSINNENKYREKIFEYIKSLKPLNQIHINSSCIAYANLISNRTDILITTAKNPWDIIPGELMLENMGYDIVLINNLRVYSRNKKFIQELKEIENS